MRINTNLTAMNTYTQYTKNNSKIASAVAKLSSGYAINTAADNAAGLAISEKMRAQIRGLQKASANAQDAISLVQTAEGALASSTEILQRMRELAVQSASDTNENEIDRAALQDEFAQLQKELDDIAKNTTFNKKSLLDGSLAKVTKNLGATELANSGMTIQLGNAATGNYVFSVTTKLESAAVEARKPTNVELVMNGASSYFAGTGGNTVTLGANVAASDLLNGNYKLSATYADPTNDNGDGQITVIATGDNGQAFEAKISAEALAALETSKTLEIKFNPEADDAFNITLNLSSNISPSENNFDTLAENISKLTVSVSGGVSAKDAVYGVYANLTGAKSVKLEAGMSSVTFDNGVKVNFDTLTASAVDTTNNAKVTTLGVIVTAPSGTQTLNALNKPVGGVTPSAASWNFSAANNKIASGNFTLVSDASGNLTLTDGAGNIYTAAAKQTTAGDNIAITYNFAQVDDASNTFNAILTLTGTGFTAGDTVEFNSAMTGSAAYTISTGVSNGTATLSNFRFADDSIVSNNNLSIGKSTDGSNTVFTATDAQGHVFTATVETASLNSSASGGSKTTTLNFISNTTGSGFTVDLTLTKSGAPDVTISDNTTIFSTTISGAGHKYTKIFGAGTDSNLAVSTISKFTVESTQNAGLAFQVGANQGDSMVINIEKMDANYLGIASASIATRTLAGEAVKAVDRAINQVSSQRAYLGAIQNRLEYKIANLETSTENLTSAESQIRDVDMAREMTNFTNANILQQAATAMLAQANALPQNVLSLIGK